jgi:hypothetical protein
MGASQGSLIRQRRYVVFVPKLEFQRQFRSIHTTSSRSFPELRGTIFHGGFYDAVRFL